MTIEPVKFSDLASSDLIVDREYQGGTRKNSADDPLHRLMSVGNMGGMRKAGSQQKDTVKLVVLYTSGAEAEWPDRLDPFSGTFTYFGDNRTAGKGLLDTKQGGNRLLDTVFQRAHSNADARAQVPPFFIFRRSGEGRSVKFLGLAAPGSSSVAPGDDLVAVWRTSHGNRFQNYRAVFTILDEPKISRKWIHELLGDNRLGDSCPAAWKEWVLSRSFRPLISERTETRTRIEQEPDSNVGKQIVAVIHDYFNNVLKSPTRFEEFAVSIWKLIAPATGAVDLTRPWRDGGIDAVGSYLLGPEGDRLAVEFSLEAKCWANSVGVKEVSRLISRLRHRQFGVFVTTSYFNKQAYDEIRADGHPVVLVTGGDIVKALHGIGLFDVVAVRRWLQSEFPPR